MAGVEPRPDHGQGHPGSRWLALGRLWDIVTTVIVCCLFLTFAWAHLSFWLDEGRLTGLVLAVQESILVVLFLIRRRPKEVSRNPVDWVAGFVGAFGALLVRPDGYSLGGLDVLYTGVQATGTLLSIWGAVYLARSFGIVAANRGVQANGPYRFVRHPIYAAYLLSYGGYLLSALSPANVAVLALAVGAQARRIWAEEKVLSNDPAYRGYSEQTRHRLIPGVV